MLCNLVDVIGMRSLVGRFVQRQVLPCRTRADILIITETNSPTANMSTESHKNDLPHTGEIHSLTAPILRGTFQASWALVWHVSISN